MLKMKHIATTFLVLLCSLSVLAEDRENINSQAKGTTGFIYGVGLSINEEIYKGYNRRIMPLPLIGYKGENLTVYGPFINYNIKDVNNIKLGLSLSPRFQGFDESDSYIFKGMKDRKNSIDAGANISYQNNSWKIALSTMVDALNYSGGYELKSTLGYTFRFGAVFVEPSISISYLDSKHVDYYYGVSDDEMNQDRNAYKGDKAVNKNIALSIATPIFFEGLTRFNVGYWQYDDAITNSPLVKTKNSVNIQLFFTKMF